MKLLTEELKRQIPELYAQDGKGYESVAYVKLFTPWSSWTWYITEYSPDENLCFGLVCGFANELGYFSIEELENIKGPCGLKVERDLYFEPTTLNQIKEEVCSG